MGALERALGDVTELVGTDSVAVDSTVSDVMGTDGVRNLVYTAATGTITLPALGTPGQRIRVIKDNATQGTVTIAADGTDTITEAGLSSVSLNADGDYWELLDISSRWELIAGRETGSNSDGEYVRYADGRQECRAIYALASDKSCTIALGGGFRTSTIGVTLPAAFVGAAYTVEASRAGGDSVFNFIAAANTASTLTLVGQRVTSGTILAGSEASYVALGPWY